MRKGLFALVLLVGGLLAFATVTGAYTNRDTKAQLNWSDDVTTLQSDLSPMPSTLTYVYVQLKDLVQIAGCEYKLSWYPAGALLSGCYEFQVQQHPAGTGTDCSWVMRGNMVEGALESGPDTMMVAFAMQEQCNSDCTQGNVAKVGFDFSMCGGDVGGYIQIDYLKLTDCAAVIDVLKKENLGDPVTIVGGTPVEPVTWGRIKSLYSR